MVTNTKVLRKAGSTGWESWLEWLDAAIHVEIARLRARYELSLDEFRGLYISDEHVNRLLRRSSSPLDISAEEGRRANLLREACCPTGKEPIWRVVTEFGISELDVAAIVVAFAPEIDPKYEILYAYLNDDVTRKHATVDLIHRLSRQPLHDVQPSSSLFVERLLLTKRNDAQSWRSTAVFSSEPLREFLLHDFPPDNISKASKVDLPRHLLSPDLRLIVIEETPGVSTFGAAVSIANARGTAIRRVAADDIEDDLLRARLRGEAAYLDSDAFSTNENWKRQLRQVLNTPVLKLIAVRDRMPWQTWLEGEDYESFRIEPPSSEVGTALWQSALDDEGVRLSEDEIRNVAALFTLHPHQIRNAVRRLKRREVDCDTLAEACRSQCTADLGLLATHETPRHGWSDLILPQMTLEVLRGFASAIRNRLKVFDDWAFKHTAGGRHSLRALFVGSSGTGKTLSASVIAKELGLDLYRIDLSSVISKYIGETEQNLERVFRAAEGSNAILFFDEADALFGKRSEVKDAHDRFSNIEIAYLLQRMEQYDGILILATNLSKNMDEAFARRIHFEVEFPMPDEEERLRLWELHLPKDAPRGEDVDLRFLSTQFPISGGDIRNVALQAAFLAADEDGPIAMRHLIRAMARQRTKQGKLPSASQFKQYFEWT